MHETAERLAESLLYEGYALYPYTPGAVKNATPTPFGIVYPPAYAARLPSTYDHLVVECVALVPAGARLEAAVRFLQATGSRHAASKRRVEAAVALGAGGAERQQRAFAFEPGAKLGVATGPAPEGGEILTGSLAISAEALDGGAFRVRVRVENTTPLPDPEAAAMERAEALRRSLLSTHTLIGIEGEGARFISPLETEGELGAHVRACENVNSWPVLAAPGDVAILGAAILLPDHPRIAEQSRGNMFDNTEIEEALTLHVQTLSDAERAEIESAGDPVVTEMIGRAAETTPDELLRMHGQMEPSDPGLGLSGAPGAAPAFPEWREPRAGSGHDADGPRASAPAGLDPADVPGEREVNVGGVSFRRGGKVILRPGVDGDPYDKMLHGQMATIRRIYLDYDGRAYLGVTVDADPMAEVMRDSGRYLFFFADELEAAT